MAQIFRNFVNKTIRKLPVIRYIFLEFFARALKEPTVTKTLVISSDLSDRNVWTL